MWISMKYWVHVCSGLYLFLAHPERFRIYSPHLRDYKSIHTHTPTMIWSTAVVEKWYPFFFLPQRLTALKKTVWPLHEKDRSGALNKMRVRCPSHVGREHSFTCWEFSQHGGRKQSRICPDNPPQQNLTINKTTVSGLWAGDRWTEKTTPFSEIWWVHKWQLRWFEKEKKKKNKPKETKQSVKSFLKFHAKYWMPQACIYLVLRSTAR